MSKQNNNNTLLKLPQPHAILFDWDNTLADTWPVIHEALNKTFKSYGLREWGVEETRTHVHKSMRDAFPELFGDKWEQAAKEYHRHFVKSHIEQLTPLAGAKEVLDRLIKTDIYLAVVSNKTGKFLREEVTHLGWDKYFTKVVGATDAEADKPHPAPVHMALDGSKIIPSEKIWFIGDTLTDLECANNTGCTPIFFGDSQIPLDYQDKSVTHTRNHSEFLNLIKNTLS